MPLSRPPALPSQSILKKTQRTKVLGGITKLQAKTFSIEALSESFRLFSPHRPGPPPPLLRVACGHCIMHCLPRHIHCFRNNIIARCGNPKPHSKTLSWVGSVCARAVQGRVEPYRPDILSRQGFTSRADGGSRFTFGCCQSAEGSEVGLLTQ